MQESMLMNPRPSQGYNAVLGNIPASSAPPQGTLAGLRPSVQNNVKEPMVNAVASYPILVQPWSNNMERFLHPGDLIFVYINANDPTNNMAPRRGEPVVVANLPMLNFLISCNNGDTTFQKFSDPNHWHLFGVMRNDMQLSRGDLGLNNRYKRYRRLINVDVRGATRCFNYWGDADHGSFAYLQWVWMKRKGAQGRHEPALLQHEEFAVLRKAMEDEIEAWIAEEAAAGRVRNRNDAIVHFTPIADSAYNNFQGRFVLQVIPRTIEADCHPLFVPLTPQEQMTMFRRQISQRGVPFSVGWCFQNIGSAERVSSATAVMAACNFQEDRFKLPLFNLFVRT